MSERAIVEVRISGREIRQDIEISLDISVGELLTALKDIYQLSTNLEDMSNCYIKTEYPIALMRGDRILKDFGVRNGTIINITE